VASSENDFPLNRALRRGLLIASQIINLEASIEENKNTNQLRRHEIGVSRARRFTDWHKRYMENHEYGKTAAKFLQKEWHELSKLEQCVVRNVVEKKLIARNPNHTFAEKRTFGEKIADKVAYFGGSWKFIIIFGCILLVWVFINSFVLVRYGDDFDPYPYILLNLFLSMLAALQAPVIMMSQNRQAIKDRHDAQHDYEVNLKAELEIANLHEKFDELSETKWVELIALQKAQIELLEKILNVKAVSN